MAPHVSKFLEIENRIRIQHGIARRDIFAADDLFDDRLDFLAVDRSRNLGYFLYKSGDVAGRKPCPDSLSNGVGEIRGEILAFVHDEEQKHIFIAILLSSSTYA